MKKKNFIMVVVFVVTLISSFVYASEEKTLFIGKVGENITEKKVACGDVNSDGRVNILDYSRLRAYVRGSFRKINTEVADVNSDGKIDDEDVKILKMHIRKEKGYETLPYIETTVLCGDVNCDGIVDDMDLVRMLKYFQGGIELTEEAMKNADLNQDSKVNLKDKEIFLKYFANFDDATQTPPFTFPYTGKVIVYGDVNCDGEVNDWDSIFLDRYLANWRGYELTEEGKRNADLYEDGKIDEQDSFILERHLVGAEEFQTLPYKKARILYGDVNCDSIVDELDETFLFRHLSDWKGYNLTEEGRRNADVYQDGQINNKDITILSRHLDGMNGYETLPYIKK